MNYWAPLNDDEEDEPEQVNIIEIKQSIANTNGNKWTRRIERRKAMKLVIDSGATSNFVPEEMNLPKMGISNKEVYLPDNTTLQATYRTELPLKKLSEKAREADILPGLKTPLISVNKMAEEGYTTIFHPGEEGVTVHKHGTVSITTTKPPVLQGCKKKGAKLWTISADDKPNTESANKVYDLPSISQNGQIPPCGSGIPNGRNLDKSHQSRQLHHMANNNPKHSPTTLPRIRRDATGSYETSATGSTINKGTRRNRNKRTCHSENERSIHQSTQRDRNDAHRPDGTFSGDIKQRKSIHNGVSRSGRKFHRRRTNEKQIGRSHD
jgi:hypothetical protein